MEINRGGEKKFPASFTSKFSLTWRKRWGETILSGAYIVRLRCAERAQRLTGGGGRKRRGDVARLIGERRRSPVSEPLSRYRSGPGKKAFNVYLPNNSSSYRGRVTRRRLPVRTRSRTNVCVRARARLGHRQSDKFALSPTTLSLVVIVAAMLFQTPEK